jgi:hypothetical protein
MKDTLDLTNSGVYLSTREKPGPKAQQMLLEEVESRTGIRLHELQSAGEGPVIELSIDPEPILGTAPHDPRLRAEGYRIRVEASSPRVAVIGAGNRGLLFGVGRLLRCLRYRRGHLSIAADLDVSSFPGNRLRGHQLGFRHKSNTYDQWGLEEYESYIRDLVVWGANGIEMVAPTTSGEVIREISEGHEAFRMTLDLSELLDSYDLDVHLWMAVNDKVLAGQRIEGLKPGDRVCPSTEAGLKYLLDSRRNLFRSMSRIDHVFIPGGDPGGCECERCQPWARTLVRLAAKLARILHEYHPEANIWLSNQEFTEEENDYLYRFIEEERPDWLGGLVYAPWTIETAEETRDRLSDRYPLRNYPDICHSVRCQYPVHEWDQAYALIEGREAPNPRPRDERHIHNVFSRHFCGSVSYSDGVNDDVNKIIWSAMDWDESSTAKQVLEEYASYLIGGDMNEEVARGIMALEDNWRGKLIENDSVEETLKAWQRLEGQATEEVAGNWRFQLCILRAYLDAYVRGKLIEDRKLEEEALEALEHHPSPEGLRECLEVLSRESGDEVLRARVEGLAGELNRNIGMKLGRKYGAQPERADILDYLDEPLNNRKWIAGRAEELLSDQSGIKQEVHELLAWEDAGPGGYYDDLGRPGEQPHLVIRKPWEEDPGYLGRASQEFDFKKVRDGRLSWRVQAATLFGTPLEMEFTDLDPHSHYVLVTTYGGYRRIPRFRLDAGDGIEIHPAMEMPQRPERFEFEIPQEAVSHGSLKLTWSLVEHARGVAVAETWLRRVE